MKVSASALIILAIVAVGCRGPQNSPQIRGEAAGAVNAAALKHTSIVTTDAELVADLEHLAERLVRADQFSGVVLLSRRGQPLFRRAYGLADREARRANTPETPFALASVSKMFTAVLVAQLAEQKRVRFDATIGSLLPDFPAGQAKSQVTVHHLLTMSSGIPDVFRLPQFWAGLVRVRTLSDFWPFFATAPLEFAPGTPWAYSNSNFLVPGSVIERAVWEPFAAACRLGVCPASRGPLSSVLFECMIKDRRR